MISPPTTIRYRTLTWLTLAAALAYLCRNAVGVAESTIREDLGLTLKQSGWFMGAFFCTYAIFQVPGGFFSQRVGTRIAMTLFAVASSVAMVGIGVSPGFRFLIMAQLMMGVAQAGIFPASCNTIGHWMPLSQRSLACGILAAGMQVGAIAASGYTGGLIKLVGWRSVFIVYALPGVLLAGWFYLRFRDRPEQAAELDSDELALIRAGREVDDANHGTETDEPTPWLTIAFSPIIWLLCGQQICRAAGYMFFASWFPTFLQETRGVSVTESGYLQGLVFAGILTGSIFGGLLTDWIWRRTGNLRLSRSGVGATFLGACALLILGAWFVQSALLATALLAAGSLFAALAGPCALAAIIDISGSRVPQIFGLMNMCGNFAAMACPVLVAMLFKRTDNWNLILLLFVGVYIVGAVCWLFVNPQRHVSFD
jgi:ACS family D-galactonate transporter-like MFS transporter